LVVTVLSQFCIIQWGGVVFRIDNGLSWQNWLISIALGSGSLVIGFILRFLPDPNPPLWMLGAGFTANDPKAAIPVAVDEKEQDAKPRGPSEMGKKWNKAIHATRMQVRVTNTFRSRTHSAANVMVDRASLRQSQIQLQKSFERIKQ
jgi:hypothetical protein